MQRLGFAIALLACFGCSDDDQERSDGAVASDGAAAPDAAPATEGGSPGGTLVMPTGLGLDLDRTATTQGSAGSIAQSVAQAAGFGQETDQVATMMLGPIGALDIPLAATVRNHTATAAFGSATLEVKIDFADYDVDGDGAPDGCSGHTGALPICMRVWVGGERYIEGRIEAHPGDDTAGKGHFTAVKVKALPGGEEGMAMALRYDHRTRDKRLTEVHWAMPADEPQLGPWATIRHMLLEQDGLPATATKTINMVSQMPSQPTATLSYLGRYKEDGDLWLGSFEAAGFYVQLGLKSFTQTCVDLTTGQAVDASQCTAAGIDLGGQTYLAFGTAADVAFSDGFPGAPSF